MAKAICQRLPEITPAYPTARRKSGELTKVMLRKQTDRKLGFLLKNFNHPSLRIKKVQGSLRGQKVVDIYELSITMNYRLLFQKAPGAYILLVIGTHDEILGR